MATVEIPLLSNPAGRGRLDEIVASFGRHDCSIRHVATTSRDETEAAARHLVAEGHPRILVAGGDGIIHLALQAVAGTDVVLGVVPVGTGNDFLGALGMDRDLDAAVTLALADPTAVDLLRVGDRWAASVATLGFSADVNARANGMRWPKGPARYTMSTVLELPRMRTRSVEVEIDGVVDQYETVLLTVANTATFGGGMRIAPDARPSDGIADITIVGSVGRVRLLRFFRRVFDGSHVTLDDVTTTTCRTMKILTPGLDLWADGEPVATSPVTIEIIPRTLRLAGAPVGD